MNVMKDIFSLVYTLMKSIKYEVFGFNITVFDVFIFVAVAFLLIWFLRSLIY